MVYKLLAVVFYLVSCPSHGQDFDNVTTTETNILAGIINTLTSSSNSIGCPGECIHALTSFFCDRVLEKSDCGAPYLRCCVPKNFNLGTPVEISPPFEVESEIAIVESNVSRLPLTTITPPPEYLLEKVTKQSPASSKISSTAYSTLTTSIASTRKPTEVTFHTPTATPLKTMIKPNISCPGLCIDRTFIRYCGNIIEDVFCAEDKTCCASDERNTAPDVLTTTLTSSPVITRPQTTTPSQPQCPGTCVAPLFSLLCDQVVSGYFCHNSGQCCISASHFTTTTTPPPIGPCPGTCIPTFLSGVCNKPAELLLETTDCASGTICCFIVRKDEDGPSLDQVLPSLFNLPLLQRPPPVIQNQHQRPTRPSTSDDQSSQQPLFSSRPVVQGPNHSQFLPPQQSRPTIPNFNRPPLSRPPSGQQFDYQPYISQGNSGQPSGHLHNPVSAGRPVCPGPCVATFLRFTCFGNNVIYPGFGCSEKDHVCCAPVIDIKRYEQSLQFNGAPVLDTTTPTPSTSPPKKSTTRRPNPYVCGIKGTKRRAGARVVGGFDSSPGEWCWQVALINSQNQYLCGGALIGTQWVLTAAHCISNLVKNGDYIYVRVGDFDLSTPLGSPGAQTRRVYTTYIHHNHNSQTLDNDIALLKLEEQIELNSDVCFVCLPARGVIRQPGKRCTVTGYGYQGEAGPVALKVRESEIPIVADQECTDKINAVTEKLFVLPASSFCAGGEEGNDACRGDGGGPLVCEVDGYYELSGLVSWGFGCGRKDVPGVYVKVSSFIGWINQIVSVNNI
ncbi:uncharacterized protein LOC143249901 [Tachypleus tridentatus]|uniref:uncharacterized protein LOC143249901 n=1 Tax=Tachypleus tridentatus TaxID=6853 RepID=UPI003FCF6A35